MGEYGKVKGEQSVGYSLGEEVRKDKDSEQQVIFGEEEESFSRKEDAWEQEIEEDDEEEEEVYPEIAALDEKLMIAPAVALDEVTKAAVSMAAVAKKNLQYSLKQFIKYDENRTQRITVAEERLDRFTDNADNYLIELSNNMENENDSRQINMLMQCIHDIERIGDYAVNFDEMALQMNTDGLAFSDDAKKELAILNDAVEEILGL